jgi:hypothetical protein
LRRKAAALFLIATAACGSSPPDFEKTNAAWADARLRGQFEPNSTPPGEVRILLDPGYRRASCGEDNVIEGYAAPRRAFVTAVVDDSGGFASPPFVISCKRRFFGKLAPPTFFVSFDNEQDTFYAIGDYSGAVQWRTYAMGTKEKRPREEACWRLLSGSYVRQSRSSIELSLIFRENLSSPKPCREPAS